MFENKTINPYMVLGLTTASCVLFYWSTFKVVPSLTDLNKSYVFQRIIACTDLGDGNDCFRDNKLGLLKEIKFDNFLATNQWDYCINTISKQNDINLLLNIQKCHHQSILIDNMKYQENKFQKLCIIISLFIQIVVLMHLLMINLIKNNQLDEHDGKIIKLNDSIDLLNDKFTSFTAKFQSMNTALHSRINYTLSRLNKGGDYYVNFESLKHNIIMLNDEFNKFKIDFFTEFDKDFFVIPPMLNNFSCGVNSVNVYPSLPSGQKVQCENTRVNSHCPNGQIYTSKPSCPPQKQYPYSYPSPSSYISTLKSNSPSKTTPIGHITGQSHTYLPNDKVTVKEDEYSPTENSTNPDASNINSSREILGSSNKLDPSLRVKTPRSFDITTESGRQQLKYYLKKEKTIDAKLRYKDIRTLDDNEKPFKRIFIPTRGWVSCKVFIQELQYYGPNAIIVSG